MIILPTGYKIIYNYAIIFKIKGHGSQSMNRTFSQALETLVGANLVFALVNE